MKYKKAKNLSDKDFKRFYGVRQETFLLMCQEVKEIENQKTSGRNSDLTVEDQVLLTLIRFTFNCYAIDKVSSLRLEC